MCWRIYMSTSKSLEPYVMNIIILPLSFMGTVGAPSSVGDMILLIGEDSSSSLSEFSPIINPLFGTGILKLENCYFQLGPLRSNEIVIFVRLPNREFCEVTKLWLLWSYANWDICEDTKLGFF